MVATKNVWLQIGCAVSTLSAADREAKGREEFFYG